MFIHKFIFFILLFTQVFLWAPNILLYELLSVRNLGLIILVPSLLYVLFVGINKLEYIKFVKSKFFIIPLILLLYSYLFETFNLINNYIDNFGLDNLRYLKLSSIKPNFFNKNTFIIFYYLITFFYIHSFRSKFESLFSKLLKLFLYLNIILQFLQFLNNPYLFETNNYFLLRSPGFFLEPSHLAIIYSGFLATFLFSIQEFKKKEFFLFLISSFFCISFVMLVMYSFLILIYIIKRKFNLYFLLSLIFITSFILFSMDYFKFRLLGIFMDAFNDGSINLSAKIFKAHALSTFQSILNFPLGVGIGNYSYSYENFLSNSDNFNYFYVLNYILLNHNYNDGTSNLFKIISEMGVFGILLILIILKNFFNSFDNKKYTSFYIFSITVFFTSLLRGAGYFNCGIIFLIAYLISYNHFICQNEYHK